MALARSGAARWHPGQAPARGLQAPGCLCGPKTAALSGRTVPNDRIPCSASQLLCHALSRQRMSALQQFLDYASLPFVMLPLPPSASGDAAATGVCRACTLFLHVSLGVLCPTLLSAHCWRPESSAADGGTAAAGTGGGARGKLKGAVRALQRLAAGCNRSLHLALRCSSRLRHCLLLWWLAAYLWAACKAVGG